MVSIKELQRDIAKEQREIKKVRVIQHKEIEKSKLKKELFMLQHRKALAAGGKGARLLRRAGRGIFKAGKKATPILKKQARLIREQGLRDDALERHLAKRKKPKKGKQPKGFGLMKDLDF